MAPRVPFNTRLQIVRWHTELGLSAEQCTTLAGCSLRTVQQILLWARDYDTVHNPFARGRSGRKRTLSTPDIEYIASALDANPKVFLDELQQDLRENRGVDVTLSTLSRTLRRLAITKKKVSSAAAERNEQLRAGWQFEYGDIPAEYFVWLDESSVDDLTNLRRHGWAAMGQACVSRDTFIRGQRYSILPALSSNGIIALDIFEGSVNKERFISMIQTQVAPILNPYPGPHSVVVMDNCAIHHDEEIRRIIVDECQARLVYLPPYSPDFNPIEQTFHSIKSWLRRHEAMAVNAAVRPWLIYQAQSAVTSEMAVGWITNCGYSFEHEML